MTAYLVMQIAITDERKWSEYREAVVPLITKFGGKHLTNAGRSELLEGRDDERSIVMFAFPSVEDIHAFWQSPDYAPIKALRRGAASLEAWAVPSAW